MPSSPAVRPATPGDAPALAALRWEFRAEMGGAEEDRGAFVRRCEAWMRARLADAGAWRCWVAEREGHVVGQAWLQAIEKVPNPVPGEPERHAYVTSCHVVPEERGAGTGGRLLDEALAWCRGAGVDAVVLWPSARSRPLYERRGFAVRDDLLELRLASEDGDDAHRP